MKVTTFNANGIRAAAKKGFFEWLDNKDSDILCIQETKAQEEQLDGDIFNPKKYHRHVISAKKKGYSGVAIYSKEKPKNVISSYGCELANNEGRFLLLEFEKYNVASIYFPSGTSGDIRQTLKMEFLDTFYDFLLDIIKKKKPYILCGDWNIAHQKIDLKNWRTNQKSSGFLPEEREWFTKMLDLGLIDAFRHLNPEKQEYTWWSNRANAWNNNVGWRLDYQITTNELKDKIKKTDIYRKEKFSDHAPFTVEYAI